MLGHVQPWRICAEHVHEAEDAAGCAKPTRGRIVSVEAMLLEMSREWNVSLELDDPDSDWVLRLTRGMLCRDWRGRDLARVVAAAHAGEPEGMVA
jgi:hypothetical protein